MSNEHATHPALRLALDHQRHRPDLCRHRGQWAFHCHIVHHVTNNDVEPGGQLFVVNVQE